MQCGAACLAMVCHYYGKPLSLADIEQYCPVTKRGVSLLNISEAAQDLGFHTRAARFTIRQIREINSPCILYWDQNHFVVLYKTRHNKFYIADPGIGKVVYDIPSFTQKWVTTVTAGFEQGIALTMTPSRHFTKSSCQGQNVIRNPFKIVIQVSQVPTLHFLVDKIARNG